VDRTISTVVIDDDALVAVAIGYLAAIQAAAVQAEQCINRSVDKAHLISIDLATNSLTTEQL